MGAAPVADADGGDDQFEANPQSLAFITAPVPSALASASEEFVSADQALWRMTQQAQVEERKRVSIYGGALRKPMAAKRKSKAAAAPASRTVSGGTGNTRKARTLPVCTGGRGSCLCVCVFSLRPRPRLPPPVVPSHGRAARRRPTYRARAPRRLETAHAGTPATRRSGAPRRPRAPSPAGTMAGCAKSAARSALLTALVAPGPCRKLVDAMLSPGAAPCSVSRKKRSVLSESRSARRVGSAARFSARVRVWQAAAVGAWACVLIRECRCVFGCHRVARSEASARLPSGFAGAPRSRPRVARPSRPRTLSRAATRRAASWTMRWSSSTLEV